MKYRKVLKTYSCTTLLTTIALMLRVHEPASYKFG
jgi:hypothetical protein